MYNKDNLILNIDSYKASHLEQYPSNVKYVSSYIESRGGEFANTLFFGLQGFIKSVLMKPITHADIDEAEKLLLLHGEPFSGRQKELWKNIVEKHNGYLPLDIRAVKEGSIVPTHNVLVRVENTDPDYFWLPSYIETALLRSVWYPTTVATISFNVRQIIFKALQETCDHPGDNIDFKLHDFGARGVSSQESAAIGGAAHLVNFLGTDTIPAMIYLMNYYNADPVPAFSIPAAEHGTITSWGKDREIDAYRNMIQKFGGPGKMVAVVSDSYDIFNAVSNIWGKELKGEVLNNGCTLVIRPDSGIPSEIVPNILERLDAAFGSTVNSKGYKVLPPAIRVIQGDGVNLNSIGEVLAEVKRAGFSAENVTFGMGGALLQHLNRDTLKFAQKISAAADENKDWFDVYKEPVTDAVKKSKRGRQKLVFLKEGYKTLRLDSPDANLDQLEPVYQNGKLLRDQSLTAIRALAIMEGRDC